MIFKVIRGQGQGQEMTSFPFGTILVAAAAAAAAANICCNKLQLAHPANFIKPILW